MVQWLDFMKTYDGRCTTVNPNKLATQAPSFDPAKILLLDTLKPAFPAKSGGISSPHSV